MTKDERQDAALAVRRSSSGGLAMPKVSSLIEGKGSSVETISAAATVLDAAELMNSRKIGSLVVVEGDAVRGILTERDILTRVVASARDPKATSVGEVMTPEPLTCRPDTPLDEVRQVMRDKRIRHLPVVDNARLVGMVSIGDLNMAKSELLEQTIHHMEVYMHGGSF
ncbi:MAG: CBS domain-containing protein [Phycisphaerales bacterium]|jgi:CBS domain-containing protein